MIKKWKVSALLWHNLNQSSWKSVWRRDWIINRKYCGALLVSDGIPKIIFMKHLFDSNSDIIINWIVLSKLPCQKEYGVTHHLMFQAFFSPHLIPKIFMIPFQKGKSIVKCRLHYYFIIYGKLLPFHSYSASCHMPFIQFQSFHRVQLYISIFLAHPGFQPPPLYFLFHLP